MYCSYLTALYFIKLPGMTIELLFKTDDCVTMFI